MISIFKSISQKFFQNSSRIIIIIFIFVGWTAQADNLQIYCAENQGEMFRGLIPCPDSVTVDRGQFCILDRNPLIYVNGCSGINPVGLHDTFFNACIEHDFCYYDEPVASGMSRKDCDKNFLSSMIQACKDHKNNSRACRSGAWSYYKAVRLAGKSFYECSDGNHLSQSTFL